MHQLDDILTLPTALLLVAIYVGVVGWNLTQLRK